LPSASPLVVYGFVVLAGVMAILFVVAHAVAARRLGGDARAVRRNAVLTLLVTAAWMALTGAAAAGGMLSRFDARPPPLLGLFAGVVVVSVATGFSRVGDRLARGLPIYVLVAAQSFRLPLELVMHATAAEGVMPVQMSFSGWNFDIVTGITSVGVAFLAWRGAPRGRHVVVATWNVLGIALLFAILAIAFVSTPLIHACGAEPARLNTFVAYFPFVWLPAVLVVVALVGHIALSRRLRRDAAERHAALAPPPVV
jgi:hypothetical protein